MAFSLCGLSYLLVVAAVIAVVFVGDVAAAVTKVWFNKIISPPSPAAPPPSFSALCCW
jgi:CDP-diglyceride synthetase